MIFYVKREIILRIKDHPILGPDNRKKEVNIIVNGKEITAFEGEMIASALMASGIRTFRYSLRKHEPRGIFCAIGRCTDCIMEVNSHPNVRTCITPVEDGMIIKTQEGSGEWKEK
jgi:predicted molibdopterin-dependent oxidoreductase YjgC